MMASVIAQFIKTLNDIHVEWTSGVVHTVQFTPSWLEIYTLVGFSPYVMVQFVLAVTSAALPDWTSVPVNADDWTARTLLLLML